jgi:DNA adenine methylase
MKAKPFIKWVGGKTQLIDQLEALLPADFDKWENVTYIEPFVGGGAMLFFSVAKKNAEKITKITHIFV